MRFSINLQTSIQNRNLVYRTKDYAFDSTPTAKEISLDILVNNVNLTINENDEVIQVWGMCPHTTWIASNHKVPEYKQGSLKLLTNLEPGFSYRLNKEQEWEVSINEETGWICIGDPINRGNSVEFNKGCVAVLSEEHLIALWLKPKIID